MHIVRNGVRLALAGALLAACSKSGSEAGRPASEPASASAPAAAGDALASVTGPYETCRALLAGDKTEGLSACAGAIKTAAEQVAVAGAAAAKPHLQATAAAAQELTAAADIKAARQAFGQVSKHLLAVLGAMPETATRYHVFECPMADGFKRWVQPHAALENPYMGSEMLACGSKVDAQPGAGPGGHDMAGH
jgi:hypothetical protein